MSRRDLPDAKIKPFPRNARGDDSPNAHSRTWGRNYNIPPIIVTEVVLIDQGGLIAVVTLYMPLFGFYFRGWHYVKSKYGECVCPPQRSWTLKKIAVADDGEETVIEQRTEYYDLLVWGSNSHARAFGEAALAAVRHAVAKRRSDLERWSEMLDDGGANANDVPF